MDVNTGHLVSNLSLIEAKERERYTPIPFHLRRAAQKKLAGRAEAHVSLTSGGALSKWAREKRQRKVKRKIAAASRRKNR